MIHQISSHVVVPIHTISTFANGINMLLALNLIRKVPVGLRHVNCILLIALALIGGMENIIPIVHSILSFMKL